MAVLGHQMTIRERAFEPAEVHGAAGEQHDDDARPRRA